MSDTGTQADPQDQGEGQVDGDPNIRILREKAKAHDEALSALTAAQRENAMLRSGIDLESPLGEFFVQSYKGDPADVEALKAEAQRIGVPFKTGHVVESEETPVPDEPTDPTGTAERRALADGAPADTGEDKDPRQVAREAFDRSMANGLPEEDAAAAHLGVLVEAANRGDKRVIYDPAAEKRARLMQELGQMG